MRKYVVWTFVIVLFLLIASPARADNSVSLVVPPRVTDFQLALTSQDADSNYVEGSTRTYNLTYGAKTSAGVTDTTVIKVDYSQDMINGTHTFDSNPISATPAYNNTKPIIDTINRTITWIIPNLPPGTINQTLSFQLYVNSNYTGSDQVPTQVNVTMNDSYVTLPTQSLDGTYTYSLPTTPTNTPTPIPGITTIPIPTSTPTPTTSAAVSGVYFNTILNNLSQVTVGTTYPAKLSLFYGTTPTNFPQSVATGTYSRMTSIPLTSLKPNTTYYFYISATNENGTTTLSNIYVFKTASAPPTVDLNKTVSLLMDTSGTILNSTSQVSEQAGTVPQVTLPANSSYQITYTLPQSINVKSIEAVLRNNNILGTNTFTFAPSDNLVDTPMIERQPNVYSAQLPSIPKAGKYILLVQITENSGSTYEQALATIIISSPLQILEAGTNNPLQDARVYFFYFNGALKKFQPITSSFASIKNPSFSDSSGFINVTLPKGMYKIEVSSLFHKGTTKEFSLLNGQNYPMIYMQKSYDLTSLLSNMANELTDIKTRLYWYVLSFATIHSFNFFASLIIAITILVTFFLFFLKTRIYITTVPEFVYHIMHHVLNPNSNSILFGTVITPDSQPVIGANIFVLDTNGTIIYQTLSSAKGRFSIKKPKKATIKILCQGFGEKEAVIPNGNSLTITLQKTSETIVNNTIKQSFGEFFGLFFEVFLVLSLVLEASFLFTVGLLLTIPFFFLSCINILLWTLYLRDPQSE